MSITQNSSRRRLLWLIPVVLVIVGLVVFFAWWQYFKTTSSYAVALLVDAAQQNDRAEFDRVVNLDRVIDNFIAQGAQDSGIGLTTSLVSSVRVQLQSLAPETSTVVKEGVREEIRTRINELAGPAGPRPFVATALAMPFVTEIKQTGQSAQVRVSRAAEIELLMERGEAGNWQVTSLRDQALARRVVMGIVKQLPQSKSELDKQLRTLPEKLPQLPFLK